jgi:hypothetical protein
MSSIEFGPYAAFDDIKLIKYDDFDVKLRRRIYGRGHKWRRIAEAVEGSSRGLLSSPRAAREDIIAFHVVYSLLRP